jgi:hypothetical protein
VVGWKDHLFRFNVLFNGTLIAQPDLNRRTEKWQGQGLQVGFAPFGDEGDYAFPLDDDGRVIQGWNGTETPVLRSEWAWDGFILHQEIFAHIPGAQPIESGTEPLFAWVRLSLDGVVEGLPLDRRYRFALKLNAPHISRSMEMRNDLTYHLDQSRYPRRLSPEASEYSPTSGYRLLESEGKVRLGMPAGQQCTVKFESGKPTEQDLLLTVEFEARQGMKVDLLVPMLPTERDVFDKELALGYEGALKESHGYWSRKPAQAATVSTPEEYINQAILSSLKSAEVIAERDPATGYYSLLSGAWTYADVWATPTAMTCVLCLDNFGYHEAVEKYLQVFKQTQGSVVPPGKAFKAHPGYLATPKSLTAINWMTDHGALLWAISTHVLVAGNKQYEEEWLPVVIKACDFIQQARGITGHGGAEGIMPPAVATDRQTEIQGVWTDGWTYKGLSTAVRLLERLNHPRAGEFSSEAAAYKEAFARVLREKTEAMPVWTDNQGKTHHLVSPSMSGDVGAEARHAFYLDTGPLFLVFAGLLDANDDLMHSTRMWFREGPPAKVYRYDSNCWQVPSLVHEMSSCEPCYSWNLFHSHQLGDRARLLQGMYSVFAGSMSRQTFTMCETRGGITALSPCSPALYMARLAVVDDQAIPNEVHLLRLLPLAWLREDRQLSFQRIRTEFGPVSLRARLADGGQTLQVSYKPEFTVSPKRVVLHVPPLKRLERIILNGSKLEWNLTQPTIVLT